MHRIAINLWYWGDFQVITLCIHDILYIVLHHYIVLLLTLLTLFVFLAGYVGNIKQKRAHARGVKNRSTLLLYNKLTEVIGTISELIDIQELTDTIILQVRVHCCLHVIVALCTKEPFVEKLSLLLKTPKCRLWRDQVLFF